MNENLFNKSQQMNFTEFAREYEEELEDEWNTTNWNKAKHQTYKLQVKIFRQVKEENYRKSRELEHILIKSRSARLYSIKEATQNYTVKQKKTDISCEAMNMALFYKLSHINVNKMKTPPKRKKHPKKKNELAIDAMIDLIIQVLIKLALEPQIEAQLETTSYGYRPLRSTEHAIAQLYHATKYMDYKWIYQATFQASLDTIDYDHIIRELGNFPARHTINSWLKADYLSKSPEEYVITPLLINVALNRIEEALGITYRQNKKGEYKSFSRYQVIRYATDVLILCKNKTATQNLDTILEPYLQERGLDLKKDETQITSIYDGIDFLGYTIKAYEKETGNHIFIRPSNESFKTFKRTIKEEYHNNKGNNVTRLIKNSNKLITTAANDWKYSSSKKTFHKADYYISDLTKRFLKRSHPNKPKKWITERYYKPNNDPSRENKYILTDPNNDQLQQKKMSQMPIKEATTIKHYCTPYDKNYHEYIQDKWGQSAYDILYNKNK